jgi:hypothetical protein
MKLIEVAKAVGNLNLNINDTGANTRITDLVATGITWVSLAAGIAAFFYLVYSGFLYLTAGGNADSAKKGQQGIMNAIIGLVIISLSYVIFRAIANQIAPAATPTL